MACDFNDKAESQILSEYEAGQLRIPAASLVHTPSPEGPRQTALRGLKPSHGPLPSLTHLLTLLVFSIDTEIPLNIFCLRQTSPEKQPCLHSIYSRLSQLPYVLEVTPVRSVGKTASAS